MNNRTLLTVLVVLALGAVALTLSAQDEPAPALQYRQKLMQGHRASMGSIGDIMKHKLPVGMKHVAGHATALSNYAALIPGAFEEKVSEGLTDAKPEVWQNWNDFLAKASNLEQAAKTLASAAEGGDMQAVMGGLKGVGDACRGCHDNYRKPEEERFERK